MSTVAEFSKKVAALVAAITEGRKNGDVNDAQWARLTELAGDVNHAVDRFNKGEGGQMAADSALAALETAVVAVLGAPAPTDGTPVPAPAAPTPPKQAPGTRQWAPSQATPPKPASPATPPSQDNTLQEIKALLMVEGEDGKLTPVNSVVKDHQAKLWDLHGRQTETEARVTAMETDIKELRRTRKGSDFNFKVAGIAAAIVFTAIVIVLVIMAQSSGYAFSIAGGISIVIGCIAGALSAGSKSSKKATDTSAA